MGKWWEKNIWWLELLGGLLILAGFGGSVWWFTAEAAQLRAVQQEVREGLITYAQAEQEYHKSEKAFQRAVTVLQEPLDTVLGLSKKFKSFEVVDRVGYGRREQVIVRGAGQVFFHEDFSDYREGDIPTEWGTGLAVQQFKDGNRYLAGVTSSGGNVQHEISFPQNFTFEFTFFNITGPEWTLTLEDARGKKFEVERFNKSAAPSYPYMRVPGNAEVSLYNQWSDLREKWGVVRLEVQGNVVRVFYDQFITSTVLKGYANFVRIRITQKDWTKLYLDSFHGVDLGEEVKPAKRG
jgi:hypothetical protein